MAKFTQKQYKSLADIAAYTPSILPFQNDTPAKQAKRRKSIQGYSWQCYAEFCRLYLPHIVDKPFCPAHRSIYENIMVNIGGLTGITGFRGLGKTAEVAICKTLHDLAIGRIQFNIQLAADEELALIRTSFLYNELSTNARILQDFPELAIVAGDETKFFLRSKALILARGCKQVIKGLINPRTSKRFDKLDADDIDKEDNQGNKAIGKRRMNKIRHECLGGLDPGKGEVNWLGNITNPNYAISQFRQELIDQINLDEGIDDADKRQHLISGDLRLLQFPLEDENEKSVWEDQYPTASLPAMRAKFGYLGYQREFLGKDLLEGEIFHPEWFQFYSTLPPDELITRVWLYSDPAWGRKGAHKAIGVIAYDGYKFYMIWNWIRKTGSKPYFKALYDTYIEMSARFGARFRPATETVFGQDRILDDLDNWCRDKGYVIIGHLFKRINTSENKFLRIERTEPTIESGMLTFCKGYDTKTLIDQYLSYPKGNIDGPDMTAGCLERFTNYTKKKARARNIRDIMQIGRRL